MTTISIFGLWMVITAYPYFVNFSELMPLQFSEEDGECIAVLSTDKVVAAPCNCNDKRQNFQWLHGTYLMNSLSRKCLSAISYPPVHGGEVTMKECPAANSPLRQGWRAIQSFVSMIWDGGSTHQTLSSSVFQLEHNRLDKKVIDFEISPGGLCIHNTAMSSGG